MQFVQMIYENFKWKHITEPFFPIQNSAFQIITDIKVK